MSDPVKHECGIAFLRLLKPLEYYFQKYGTVLYGIEKMWLLLEKQHNRGQDGAGILCLKLHLPAGRKYFHYMKSVGAHSMSEVFQKVFEHIRQVQQKNSKFWFDTAYLKENVGFVGEILLGHLRYGTFGKNDITHVHPVVRQTNWKGRSLALAGNFNVTNVDVIFQKLITYGEHPVETSDTATLLEKIGFFLDRAYNEMWQNFVDEGKSRSEATELTERHIDLVQVLRNSLRNVDGGYALCGVLGTGDAFLVRDPCGIRPLYYYQDDEVFVAASERPAIQTSFNVPFRAIQELQPARAIIVRADGNIETNFFTEPQQKRSCSFERIYFSRGTDVDIYRERKRLGQFLTPRILEAIRYDFEHTVFSFIPNTALAAFMGMREELFRYLNEYKKAAALRFASGQISREELDRVFSLQPRIETIAVKDIKLRTFITQDAERDELVTHVYDVTYGVVADNVDTLVVLDDSIVRGTTLRQSIIRMLDRLNPKRIIIVSSAPQVRYPDCYGIDMAKLADFIAFQAAIQLLRETKNEGIINEVYRLCKEYETKPHIEPVNYVKKIYEPFTDEQIARKIAQLVTSPDIRAEVDIIFQRVEDLHKACPDHLGDWYFTGDYPTPGGYRVVNRSFVNYIEGKDERGYGLHF